MAGGGLPRPRLQLHHAIAISKGRSLYPIAPSSTPMITISRSGSFASMSGAVLNKKVQGSQREAFKWYRQAALQKYPPAEFHLGLMYQKGRGTAKNPEMAIKLIVSAALQGHRDAKAYLKSCNLDLHVYGKTIIL